MNQARLCVASVCLAPFAACGGRDTFHRKSHENPRWVDSICRCIARFLRPRARGEGDVTAAWSRCTFSV